jgi:cytoskeletal protein RodZ
LPLVIGIVVLVAGFSLLKLMMDVRRITPATQRDAQALAQASATPLTSSAGTAAPMTAPRALAADQTPAPTAPVVAADPQPPGTPASAVPAASAPAATVQATVAASAPTRAEEEPEIRRAEPVHPEELVQPPTATANAAASQQASVNNFDIRPLRKTYVRVVVDGGGGPAVERWLNISEAPLQLRGQKIAVKVLDPAAVEIRKNGKVITRGDADVRLE